MESTAALLPQSDSMVGGMTRRRLLLVGLAGTIIALLWAMMLAARAPSDEELRTTFQAQLRDFEELRDAVLLLPHTDILIGSNEIAGEVTSETGYRVYVEHEGVWQTANGQPVALHEALATLSVGDVQFNRITGLLHRLGGASVRKSTYEGGTRVLIWVHTAGVFGVAKAIAFVDREPGRILPHSTDTGSWSGGAYVRLGRDGWFIFAVR